MSVAASTKYADVHEHLARIDETGVPVTFRMPEAGLLPDSNEDMDLEDEG